MSQPVKPTFEPVIYPNNLEDLQQDGQWVTIVAAQAHFPLELFEAVLTSLIHYPERTTSLILRAELVEELDQHDKTKPEYLKSQSISGFDVFRRIRRRLLPRRPDRDKPMDQDCVLYCAHRSPQVDLVVFFPLLNPGETIPWYHPDVEAIAFRYVDGQAPIVRIDVIKKDKVEGEPRLLNTCRTLLETICTHGWGFSVGYQKRVVHDTVVERSAYQDLYWTMRERYKGLVYKWVESTDATKNVFEDVGIATFLMLLWKQMYPSGDIQSWGRPPGGFIDIGCGAGLLVHILLSEGYIGKGIDVRARKSWIQYDRATSDFLQVYPLNPLDADFPPSSHFSPGVFLIGNHPDEMTPWIPLIASLVSDAAYISIPCCPWSFDERFHRNTLTEPFLVTPSDGEIEKRIGMTKASTYGSYLCWLAQLNSECGFVGEYEALRMPSTRYWAIIGRRRVQGGGEGRARELLGSIRDRGLFKPRSGTSVSSH